MGSGDDTYTRYLEREMTIMAALSAFCLGSVGLWAKAALGAASPASAIWMQSPELIIGGCTAEFVAAWLFYLQRSHLCWLYGQICLSLTSGGHPDGVDYRSWLYHADSRASWMAYRAAFYALGIGFVLWALVAARHAPIARAEAWPYLERCLIWVPPITLCALAGLKWRVYTVFHLHRHPWREAGIRPLSLIRGPWTMTYEQIERRADPSTKPQATRATKLAAQGPC
jgi:hypothetical protein